PDGSFPHQKMQWYSWYMDGGGWYTDGFAGALDLRHNRAGNVWYPDGHTGSWKGSDTQDIQRPDGGPIGYVMGYTLLQ
ncbi:MAG: hypothetical protein D6820_06670, partial [Lentisphaerae bacterium]